MNKDLYIFARSRSDTARPTALARRSRPGSLQASSDCSPVSERPRTTVSVGALHPGLDPVLTRGGICVPPTVTYLPYGVSNSTLTAVGRSQLLARWPGTHCRILSGIQRAAQTVLGVYLKLSCSRVTSASSALGVQTIMRYTNPPTHSRCILEDRGITKEQISLFRGVPYTDSNKYVGPP